MNIWEIIGAFSGVVVLALQTWNTYQHSETMRAIADVKTMMFEKFVTKEDMRNPWYRESAQVLESQRRNTL